MSVRQRSLAQQIAEADVERHRRDLGPFVVAAEETRMPMVFTNALEPHHPIVFANDAFVHLTGYGRETLLGTRLGDLVAPNSLPSVQHEISRAFDGAEVNPEFGCRTRDGRDLWVSLHVSPVRDERGQLVQHFASLFDLTRHVSEQRNARLLLDELNHRVRNNLAVIQSIARLGAKRLTSPSTLGRAIEDRIVAISHAQRLLEKAQWLAMPVRGVLLPPVSAALQPDRYLLDGPDLLLTAAQSWTLSLTVQELVLSARARKILFDGSGRLRVVWHLTDQNTVRIQWDELGVVGDEAASDFELGRLLMERQVEHELAERIATATDELGYHCTIEFPLQRPS